MQFTTTNNNNNKSLFTNSHKQIKGQFGFNPNQMKLINSKLANLSNSNSMNSNEKPFKFTSAINNKEKKTVKRLTSNTKFTIDSMSKKHHDCK